MRNSFSVKMLVTRVGSSVGCCKKYLVGCVILNLVSHVANSYSTALLSRFFISSSLAIISSIVLLMFYSSVIKCS